MNERQPQKKMKDVPNMNFQVFCAVAIHVFVD